MPSLLAKRSLPTFCAGCPQTVILLITVIFLISASQVAGIIAMSHNAQSKGAPLKTSKKKKKLLFQPVANHYCII
jgi:hypothetical protein